MPAFSSSRLPWLLVGLVMAAGVFYSPWTAARRIRVVGVPSHDQQRVQSIVETLARQPWKLVNESKLLSEVRENPAIESATFEANLVGRGILKVTYREPVALIAGYSGLAIDEHGQIFSVVKTSGLPFLLLPKEALGSSASLSHGFDLKGAGQLARLVRQQMPASAWNITMDARSVLVLSRKGAESGRVLRVLLGDSDRLEEKVTRLADILAVQPKLFEASEINLTVPNQPVYRP